MQPISYFHIDTDHRRNSLFVPHSLKAFGLSMEKTHLLRNNAKMYIWRTSTAACTKQGSHKAPGDTMESKLQDVACGDTL